MSGMLKSAQNFIHLPSAHRITMQRRLMLYLLCLILAASAVLLVLLPAIGGYLRTREQIAQVMESQMRSVSHEISEEMETYTGYGLQLSRELKQDIVSYLNENDMKAADLNDQPEQLLAIEEMMYAELNTAIRLGRSSGAFALINATVNTQAASAAQSRTGVYLRLTNVSSNFILNPETILFRGSTAIARENGLELHSRWNMEIDTSCLPGYQNMAQGLGQKEPGCYWISRMNLKDTWENVILLAVPMYTDEGEFLGMCGIELNDAHFNLKYSVLSSSYGPIVTAIAPTEKGRLRIDQGMIGSSEGTWLDHSESLSVSNTNSCYSTYHGTRNDYYGIQRELEISGSDGQKWAAAVLMPSQSCDRYIHRNTFCMIGIIAGFIMIMIVTAWILSRKFVNPILQSFHAIQDGRQASEDMPRVAEVEELCTWFYEKGKETEESELPPHMEELLKHFADNVKTLTNGEYNIFQYYMKGCKISQIPSAACISMSTVKKHNGNIYRKLEISSYEELMMYLDLFRRCGCIDKLQRNEKTDLS